ncbi:MAG: hypothetical protein ACI8P0_004830 [Planctomycetaceae bacterium]
MIGLAPAAVALLRRHGYQAHYQDETDRSLPEAARGAVSKRGIRDSALLSFVSGNAPCGLIEYRDREVDPAWIVAQIALEWPDAEIIVISATRANAERMAACLKRYLAGSQVGMAVSDAKSDRRRLTVVTPGESIQAGMLRVDFVIALDAVEAVGLRQQVALLQPMKARTFGLMKIGQRLSRYERDMITASFGFERLRIHRHGVTARPVTVVQIAVRGGERVAKNLNVPSTKLRAITQHGVRNRLICSIAKAVESQNAAKLHSLVPWQGWSTLGRARTVILVESVDHAIQLAKRLPHWAVLAGEHVGHYGWSNLDGLVTGESLRSVWRSNQNVIVTFEGLRRAELQRVGVVIRADGLPGIPAPLTEHSVSGNTKSPLVVVDLDDRDHHPLLRQWTQNRRDAALDAVWTVIRSSGQRYTEVDRFLDSRKEGTQ